MTAAGPAARIGFIGCPRRPRLRPGPRAQRRELRACPNNLPETPSPTPGRPPSPGRLLREAPVISLGPLWGKRGMALATIARCADSRADGALATRRWRGRADCTHTVDRVARGVRRGDRRRFP